MKLLLFQVLCSRYSYINKGRQNVSVRLLDCSVWISIGNWRDYARTDKLVSCALRLCAHDVISGCCIEQSCNTKFKKVAKLNLKIDSGSLGRDVGESQPCMPASDWACLYSLFDFEALFDWFSLRIFIGLRLGPRMRQRFMALNREAKWKKF